MQSTEAPESPTPRRGWLGNLAMVVFQPRRTIRRLLDQRSHRILPLVLLAIGSSMLKDPDVAGLPKALQAQTSLTLPLIITCIVVAVILGMLLLFYVLSWIAFVFGRLFEGRGEVVEVRTALA